MTESAKRAKANKTNAELSTGPKSAVGKANSSANATTHGVLSRKLLLADESAEEYSALLASLLRELEPVGTMEQLLVERVAVSVWRQRRMVGAETGSLAEQQCLNSHSAVHRVRMLAGLQAEDDETIKSILEDLPSSDIFAKQVELLTNLARSDDGVADLKKKHSLLWTNLCSEADIDASLNHADQCEQIESYLAEQYRSLQQWITIMLSSSQKLLKIVNAANTVRAALAMPMQSDLLSRYQAALDNEWFKGLRALREAQKFRLDQAARNATPIPKDGD